MKLTDRDIRLLNFLKEYKCANTGTIERLFFKSKQTAQKRLKILTDNKKIKKVRENINTEYTYYINKKPRNIPHTTAISEVYSYLSTSDDIKLIKAKREYEIKYRNKSIRADLMAVVKVNDKIIPLLIEIDLNKTYNNKYTEYISNSYYRQLFPIKPIIISISKYKPKSSVKIIHFKNVEEFSKNIAHF